MGKSKDATFAQDAARRLYVEFALTTIYAIGVCGAIVASSQMTMEILNAPRLLLVALARTSCPGVAAAERVCVWRRWGGGGSVGGVAGWCMRLSSALCPPKACVVPVFPHSNP